MPNITEIDSSAVQLYSEIFWALDYIPIVSSVKCLADLFFSQCLDMPEDRTDLSSFSFAYYKTLKDKSEFRYIAFIPIAGNIVLILSDAYDAFNTMQIDGNIDKARSGDIDAIESLLQGNTAQKAVAFESGCGIESLKWTLCSAFAEEDSSGKAEIVNTLKHAANNGNQSAYKFLVNVLMEYYATGSDLRREIYAWVLDKCKDLMRPCHELAWETVKAMYDGYRDRDSILPVFLELVKNRLLPRNKADYLADKLERVLRDHSTPSPMKVQIVNAFRQMADQDYVVFMHQLGVFLFRQGNGDQGRDYIERAASNDHLPSILFMGQLCESTGNLVRAIFWYEKAERQDPSVSPILSRLRAEFLFESQRARHQAGAQQAQAQEEARRRWAAEEARQRAAEEEEAERQRQEEIRQAAVMRGTAEQQLRRIFGTGFTTSQELSAAFREWSRRNHPDRGGNVATFQRVNHLVGIIRESRAWR